ncbi:deoxyuridine 5'-triphosphate nucleotidohydrolase [Hyphomicrobium facile]|uniref:Deoxyuridine 5'-triphosphate nucleotidohydrolase n=1 Tax=Hyphomicrobium facile TaxID=51670 RepID=A0A1I7NTK8_9HYPH|nr:dUTP diphosphatase [Hyphomicrobium facile]SFV37973.1 deoxyuridine 5'-triphosphate nucleotidohydrolase [Hyphomicrobium facile]
MKVKVRRLEHAEGLPLPDYQTEHAAGFDLVAAVPDDVSVTIAPGARALIPTGLIFELPRGMEAQVRPRSGLAVKHGVTVLNSPGTIDADYRGEVAVILINHGTDPFVVARGERVAQMIVAPVARVKLREAKRLTATKRGAGGFGSTGISEAPSHDGTGRRKAVAKRSGKAQKKSKS